MASTVITAPELHEETDEVVRAKLLEYVPMFRQHMDRGAGSLIGDLESIIEHRLWARVGYDSMEAYAREHLLHSEQWCHDVIRIYRHDWSPEQRAKLRVADLVASVEPAGSHGGNHNPEGKNQHTKDEPGGLADLVASVEPAAAHGGVGNPVGLVSGQVDNINLTNSEAPRPKKKRKGGTDPEYVIARLKRDQADPEHPDRDKAGFLLAGIERGEIKPYKAAKAMGYVKAPDPAAIVEKQREKLEPEEQVIIWQQWGRALPDDVIDRVGVAQEAFDNLMPDEQQRFMRWARARIKQAA